MFLPQMSGPLMVKQMNARGIHIPVIFLSGYTDDRLAAHGFDPQQTLLIRKPFTAPLLLDRVKETLADARAGESNVLGASR
jgi:FixJ family two-component response regulator